MGAIYKRWLRMAIPAVLLGAASAWTGTAGQAVAELPTVAIMAEDGVSDPSAYVSASGSAAFTALLAPDSVAGEFHWSTTSEKLALVNSTNQTVEVTAGQEASASVGAETLKLVFTPDGHADGIETIHPMTVVKVEIVSPKGSLDANPNPVESWLSDPDGWNPNFRGHRFDFQGVVAGATGPYVLDIEGRIEPADLGFKWTLDEAAGTLANTHTAAPTHTAPHDEGQGTLILEALDGANKTGCKDQRTVIIYKDHLARNMENFGTGISCEGAWTFTAFNATITMQGTWNCHGSSRHLYDGSGTGGDGEGALDFSKDWEVAKEVAVSHHDEGGIAIPDLGPLYRGDLILYYAPKPEDHPFFKEPILMHSQTCTGNGAETYGANNEPLSYPGAAMVNESYRWGVCTAGAWAINTWQPDFPPGSDPGFDKMPVTIKVLRKPTTASSARQKASSLETPRLTDNHLEAPMNDLAHISSEFKDNPGFREVSAQGILPFLSIGMTSREILEILGPPTTKSSPPHSRTEKDETLWRYAVFYSKTIDVYFCPKGKVEKIMPVGIDSSP